MSAVRPLPSICLAAAGLAAFVAAAGGVRAQTTEARDTVILVSGKELKGRVVRVTAKQVVLRVGSVDRPIQRAEVKQIVSVASKHRELLARWRDTNTDDVHALLTLAKDAGAGGLPHETRLFLWYAALQRRDDRTIHEQLGNRQRGGKFLVAIGDRQVPFAEADALGKDFANAWQLRSEHFALRCAAGLRIGLDTLLELEAFYWMFHELFGEALELFELVEAIDVRVHRTREQMPNLSNTVGAYFAVDERTLYTFAEGGRAYGLEHEATHALLHFFFERAAKSRGALPAWLDEGWAEYMNGRVNPRAPGKPVLRERSVIGSHSQLLATLPAEDRYGVHRLLNFKYTDFGASSGQGAKYAQSWALFRWLFEHQDPAVRALFTGYLREAAEGQGQASTFRRIFARMERELETAPWK
ncbi:MAG: DUF1570 domain-containing protein [Planctomycetota bacterium]